MEYSLEVENLSKEYTHFALSDISIKLQSGSIMGFIGENGAGKTTTIKAILNLIKKDSGTIKIFGLDNIKDEKKIKEQIGVVFDECNFHDTLKADNINKFMPQIYSNWDSEVYYSYIKKFKLPRDKVLKEFSRGMKMKLSIAVAMSHKPKLLILDEATSGLDPVVRNEILDVFFDFIQDDKHSILMSSHITSDLERIADYITFIHDGKIILCDNKDNIMYNHALIKCSAGEYEKIERSFIVGARKNNFGYEVLVRNKPQAILKYSNMVIDSVSLEEIMLFYVRGNK